MAKLPTTLLQRSLPCSSPSSSLLLSTASSSARPTLRISSRAPTTTTTTNTQQVRHATEIVRPKRPYTFTQVVQLSDGSTYTARSTSPLPVYRSTKDTRNHLTWQPSESTLKNVEVDEAGKLASFRGRFGTQYDLGDDPPPAADVGGVAVRKAGRDGRDGVKDPKAEAEAAAEAERKEEEEKERRKAEEEKRIAVDSFAELMASYVREDPNLKGGQVASNRVAKKGKKK